MTWRSLLISQPAKLQREHFSLVVKQAQAAYIPFEDIAVIVLNHREITLTHPVLSACAEYGISLFSTGDNHQPNGVFLAYSSHHRSTKFLRLQLNLPRPLLKQLWTQIVRVKVSNQAQCLNLAGVRGVDRLLSYARRIRSGDVDNVEGMSASVYFPCLFGDGFRRSDDSLCNSALDYGYAILRGAIARCLVAHGLFPALGMFHASEQNAFNLADDLIEPLRPVVDLAVKGMAFLPKQQEATLSPRDKAYLVSLLNVDVAMPLGNMSVLVAIETMVESLSRAYQVSNADVLQLPKLIGLNAHQREI